MKNLNKFITEYIIKKKLDTPIDSSVTDVYEEIDDLIDLDNYDKKIRDCVKKWIDQFDVKSIVYYTINKRLLERYVDISLIENKLMSEDEFQQMKANSSSDFIPIDLIKTPKVTVKCIVTARIQNTNINAPFFIISEIDAGTPNTTKNK